MWTRQMCMREEEEEAENLPPPINVDVRIRKHHPRRERRPPPRFEQMK